MKENKMTTHDYPWATKLNTLLDDYVVDIESGLKEDVVVERQNQYGKNVVDAKRGAGPWQILYRQFQSPLIFILLLAVIATLALAEYIDAAIVTLAILVNAGLGFYQEFRAERAVEHLQSFITVRTRVMRGGKEQEIDAHDIVPGDIVHLTMGSRVPADGRIISQQGLRVDEAVLTGESLPVGKEADVLEVDSVLSERTNMVYGGTLVTEGSAMMLVVAIGAKTEFGKIATLVGTTNREATPLQKAVHKLAWLIAGVISILVAGVFALGLARGETVFDMFLVSIAVAVGAIPEALPIGLTAVLAVGVERLAKRKGVMRNLTAAETLGSTTVVITDKTGTLTQAKLDLISIYSLPELLATTKVAVSPSELTLSPEQKDILYTALLATDVIIENPDDEPPQWRISGPPIEATLVQGAAMQGLNIADAGKTVSALPFNSHNKFSVSTGPLRLQTMVSGKRFGNARIIIGAPDVLAKRAKITKDEYLKLLKRLEAESHAGRRLLGLAVMYLPEDKISNEPVEADEIKDIQLLGMMTFVDPIRAEVPEAIKKIEHFGVRVIIATGDLPGTAVAVARQLGWEVLPHEVITGDVLAKLSDEELDHALAQVKIFARVTPADKLRIAKALQAKGEVVAMTGDGVNDAPSLKAVDIGIAVGSGSDVAKGVADLILLDDNFNTIVSAIEEGKRVMRNIRKTFVYLMSNSLDEIFLIGGSLIAGIALPLTAMQIIWVNFFTGSIPAVAFAFDSDEVTGRKHGGPEKIINAEVKYITLVVGVSTSLLLFTMYYFLTDTAYPLEEIQTFIFVCFSVYILLVAFSLRSLSLPIWRYNPFTNNILNFGVGGGLLLTLATVYVTPLQSIFSTVSLSLFWWFWVGVWVLFAVGFVEVVKWGVGKLDSKKR
ncbi:MAG: cation-translocating P-type ATPase [Candidatus Paceibacteria bacterium]